MVRWARHPTLRTPDGEWTVEDITARGGQSFRVKNLQTVPRGTMNPPGRIVATITELREVMGDDYDQLIEDRSGRFNGDR